MSEVNATDLPFSDEPPPLLVSSSDTPSMPTALLFSKYYNSELSCAVAQRTPHLSLSTLLYKLRVNYIARTENAEEPFF